MALTLDEPALKRMFPKASRSFFEANAHGVSDSKPQRDPVQPLDSGAPRKKESAQRTVVRIVRYGCRLLDRDNLQGGAKPCVDCLKEAGLIVDDTEAEIDLIVTQERVFNKDQQRTEIEITWPDG